MRKFLAFVVLVLSMPVLGQVPTNGLVAYYPFNGNANDESGNGSNGVVNGATLTTDRFGNSNNAYSFNGISSYIDAVVPGIPLKNSPRSITGWFKTNNPTAFDLAQICILNYGSLSANQRFSLCIYAKSYLETISGGQGPSGSDFYINNANYLNNDWYFFTLMYNGSVISLYVNGILRGGSSPVNLNTTNNTFRIGRRIAGDNYNEFFKGTIDDIRIYNRALTPTEISTLYNEKECYNKTTIDTTTYHVSDSKFQALSPRIEYINDDTLRVPSGGCLNYRIHYAKFVYSPNHYTDTVHVSTTDTLVINASITGLQTPNSICKIKVYPNPAKDHLVIDYGNYVNLNSYTLKITNTLGASVFTTAITQQTSYVDIKSWSGNGIYFVYLIDSKGNTVETRKIIIQ